MVILNYNLKLQRPTVLAASLLLCLSGTASPTSPAVRDQGSIQVTAHVVGSGEALRANQAARLALASPVELQTGTHDLTGLFEEDWRVSRDEWFTRDGMLRLAWAPGGPDCPEAPSPAHPIGDRSEIQPQVGESVTRGVRILVIEYVGN